MTSAEICRRIKTWDRKACEARVERGKHTPLDDEYTRLTAAIAAYERLIRDAEAMLKEMGDGE